MKLLNPYLHFNGQCEEAFNFYAKVLGGEIVAMMPHKDTPAEEHVPAEWRNKIIHARLMVGDKLLMASDAPPDRFDQPKGFSVTVGVDTAAEAERIFNAFAEGGTVRMPMGETFFAERFGMVADRFGTPWMILCEKAA
ncbi:MAG: VOC family protein [Methyloceanibacter sp.]